MRAATCSTSARRRRCGRGCARTSRRARATPARGSGRWRPASRRSRRSSRRREVEALHLEQNLIKRHRPPYNVRLRDDKSFPYIAVTVEDDFPRVMFTRERHRRGVVYFGPYANAKTVRETLDVLNRVFRYRPCEGPQPGRRSGIPCLDFHIERCHAPCVGYISKDGLPRPDRAGDRVSLRRRPADPAPARASRCRRRRPPSGSRTPPATATGCARSSGCRSGRRSSGSRSGRST